jgi:hypothetical protein
LASLGISVSIKCSVQKDPLKFAKSISYIPFSALTITHWFDYESDSPTHRLQFLTSMERMKITQDLKLCKKYNMGYSNFTFELWFILHKTDCNASFIENPSLSIMDSIEAIFKKLFGYNLSDNKLPIYDNY